MVNSSYLSQTQLAKRLGVGRTTISYWHRKHMIPEPKRLNGRPVYAEEDIQEIIRIRGIDRKLIPK